MAQAFPIPPTHGAPPPPKNNKLYPIPPPPQTPPPPHPTPPIAAPRWGFPPPAPPKHGNTKKLVPGKYRVGGGSNTRGPTPGKIPVSDPAGGFRPCLGPPPLGVFPPVFFSRIYPEKKWECPRLPPPSFLSPPQTGPHLPPRPPPGAQKSPPRGGPPPPGG